MKIEKKLLLYDIANLAFTIADTGEENRHILHRVRDICQEGNIDRVKQILSLAYSRVLGILIPILDKPGKSFEPSQKEPEDDYYFYFLKERGGYRLTKEILLNIKETIHEYMICMVLADWLGITLPEAADVWKFRAEENLEALAVIVAKVINLGSPFAFKRKIEVI